MEEKLEAAEIMARYAAGLRFEDIPSEVRESTKASILDTLGVALAGSTLGQADGYPTLIELIRDGGGKRESTILGFGDRVPAWMAAFANAALARVLHYDDIHDEAVTHPSCIMVPATLAVAERVGNVGGKELLTAVTLGNDITSRMGLSICQRRHGWKPDWFQTTVHGVFGATAACAKILQLDTSRMQNALGIALNESSGTLEGVGMSSGFAAKGAVISALMAEKGIKGAKNSLEGKAGLYSAYYGSDYNRDVLVSDLGRRFESAGISFKPWPGLRYFHPYIDATLQLVNEHSIAAETIGKIKVFVAGFVQTYCEPLEVRRCPATLDEANKSLPYLVAVAAAKKRVTLKDISVEGINDHANLRVAQRVVPEFDSRFGASNEIGPAKVEIELIDGQSYSKQLSVAYGHPRNPMSKLDVIGKFRDCASHSIKPLPSDSIERAVDMLSRLEGIVDVGQIVRLLA